MTCLQCGGEMQSRRENYQYTSCGLPNVTLEGIEVRRCGKCGETEAVIPNVEGLHRALARGVVRQKARLAPTEIRFLRKFLGLSGVEFARHVGVEPETVSRWESGAARMGATAERLLRWFVATREPERDLPLDLFTPSGNAPAKPQRFGLSLFANSWLNSAQFASVVARLHFQCTARPYALQSYRGVKTAVWKPLGRLEVTSTSRERCLFDPSVAEVEGSVFGDLTDGQSGTLGFDLSRLRMKDRPASTGELVPLH